jgi:hypothetical protein
LVKDNAGATTVEYRLTAALIALPPSVALGSTAHGGGLGLLHFIVLVMVAFGRF